MQGPATVQHGTSLFTFEWWFTVVLVGAVVGVLSSYLKDGTSRLYGIATARRKKRMAERLAKEELHALVMASDQTEVIFYLFGFLARCTMMVVGAVLVVGAPASYAMLAPGTTRCGPAALLCVDGDRFIRIMLTLSAGYGGFLFARAATGLMSSMRLMSAVVSLRRSRLHAADPVLSQQPPRDVAPEDQ